MIIPGMLIEGSFYYHPLPKFKSAAIASALFGVAYAVMVTYIGLTNGIWVYPFLTKMPLMLKFVFFIITGASGLVLLKSSTVYHQMVWRKGPSVKGKKKIAQP